MAQANAKWGKRVSFNEIKEVVTFATDEIATSERHPSFIPL